MTGAALNYFIQLASLQCFRHWALVSEGAGGVVRGQEALGGEGSPKLGLSDQVLETNLPSPLYHEVWRLASIFGNLS